MKIMSGDIIAFRGCTWNEPQWEFDSPTAIYSGVKRYFIGRSIEDAIESICIDICVDNGDIDAGWHSSDLKEFKWRGWSPRGFSRRQSAGHAEIIVEFFTDDDGDLDFCIIAASRWMGGEKKRHKFFSDIPIHPKKAA